MARRRRSSDDLGGRATPAPLNAPFRQLRQRWKARPAPPPVAPVSESSAGRSGGAGRRRAVRLGHERGGADSSWPARADRRPRAGNRTRRPGERGGGDARRPVRSGRRGRPLRHHGYPRVRRGRRRRTRPTSGPAAAARRLRVAVASRPPRSDRDRGPRRGRSLHPRELPRRHALRPDRPRARAQFEGPHAGPEGAAEDLARPRTYREGRARLLDRTSLRRRRRRALRAAPPRASRAPDPRHRRREER